MLSQGVILNLGSAKVCSPAIIETNYSYGNDIWIAVTDNFTAILQLINSAAFNFHFLYMQITHI